MRRLTGAPPAHQLLIARLLAGLLKDKPDPLAHLDVFEREIMADVAALPVDADHAEGLEIPARVREEMAAIVQLLRDGLRLLAPAGRLERIRAGVGAAEKPLGEVMLDIAARGPSVARQIALNGGAGHVLLRKYTQGEGPMRESRGTPRRFRDG